MADVNINPFDGTTDNGNIQNPARGDLSVDLITSGAQLDDDDTVIIDCEFNNDIEIMILDTGCGSTVTVEAGDYPPSPHAAKGDLELTIPADDLLRFVPEAGRHMQDNGTIRLTVGCAEQVLVWVFQAPAGFVGVGSTNQRTVPAMPTD